MIYRKLARRHLLALAQTQSTKILLILRNQSVVATLYSFELQASELDYEIQDGTELVYDDIWIVDSLKKKHRVKGMRKDLEPAEPARSYRAPREER